MSNRSELVRRLAGLSGQLYRDTFHLINTLSMVVDDCGYLLGTVDMGTEDSGRRVVNIYGWPIASHRSIVIVWATTEYGNLEIDLDFV